MKHAIITGGSGGLGRLILGRLKDDHVTFNWSLETGVDLTDASAVKHIARATLRHAKEHVDVLVNCAGYNKLHPMHVLTSEEWDMHMHVNARALWYTTRELIEYMRGGVIVNIVSNASHVPMTHSLAYNASKAAAHMTTLQMAHELGLQYDVTIFGVSPNKLANTPMTAAVDAQVVELRQWTIEQARAYQLSKLPTREETDPEALAEFITYLLTDRKRYKYLHGTVIPYGG